MLPQIRTSRNGTHDIALFLARLHNLLPTILRSPQLFWQKPKNRIAKAVTQTTILGRLDERTIESPLSLEWVYINSTNLFLCFHSVDWIARPRSILKIFT